MAVKLREELKEIDDVDVTPMLGLAYVLLVIFIVFTTAAVQGVRVELPLTQAVENIAKPQTRAITITRDGTVFLDAFPVNMEQLETRLAQHRAANPALSVVLKADGDAQYEQIMQALEICKRLDITEIGLASKRAI